MPNIRPISDLHDHEEVLSEVTVGSPVFLTEDGRGRYVILDIHDYEKMMATLQLRKELDKDCRSGETEGG